MAAAALRSSARSPAVRDNPLSGLAVALLGAVAVVGAVTAVVMLSTPPAPAGAWAPVAAAAVPPGVPGALALYAATGATFGKYLASSVSPGVRIPPAAGAVGPTLDADGHWYALAGAQWYRF